MIVQVRVCALLLVGAMGAGALGQQPGERSPAATVGAELRALASRAGVVFVGQVAKIEPKDGVVEITFAVEQPVLGVVGGTYRMREWAGRWTAGQERFRAGQRALFFLHTPNAAGLSSTVNGMIGAVPLVPMGSDGQAVLDVRWVATRVKRATGAPLAAGTGGIALADGIAVAKSWQSEELAEPKAVPLPEGVAGVAQRPALARGPGPVVGLFPMNEAFDAQR